MLTISEGDLTFHFPDEWRITKFDQWSFCRKQFQYVCGGAKSLDILAIGPRGSLWFIEIKDYRRHRRTKAVDIADEVAFKVRDTLAALLPARLNAGDASERELAARALTSRSLHVVLHLEQPAKHPKLLPRSIDPARVAQRLKQLIKPIDAHPRVLEMGRMRDVDWTVT